VIPSLQMPAARRAEAVLEEEERKETLSKLQAFIEHISPAKSEAFTRNKERCTHHDTYIQLNTVLEKMDLNII
jgi:hypothetical protein